MTSFLSPSHLDRRVVVVRPPLSGPHVQRTPTDVRLAIGAGPEDVVRVAQDAAEERVGDGDDPVGAKVADGHVGVRRQGHPLAQPRPGDRRAPHGQPRRLGLPPEGRVLPVGVVVRDGHHRQRLQRRHRALQLPRARGALDERHGGPPVGLQHLLQRLGDARHRLLARFHVHEGHLELLRLGAGLSLLARGAQRAPEQARPDVAGAAARLRDDGQAAVGVRREQQRHPARVRFALVHYDVPERQLLRLRRRGAGAALRLRQRARRAARTRRDAVRILRGGPHLQLLQREALAEGSPPCALREHRDAAQLQHRVQVQRQLRLVEAGHVRAREGLGDCAFVAAELLLVNLGAEGRNRRCGFQLRGFSAVADLKQQRIKRSCLPLWSSTRGYGTLPAARLTLSRGKNQTPYSVTKSAASAVVVSFGRTVSW